MCSATATTDCTVMRIDKKSMMEVIHRERAFYDMFVAYVLTRNIRYEEDFDKPGTRRFKTNNLVALFRKTKKTVCSRGCEVFSRSARGFRART